MKTLTLLIGILIYFQAGFSQTELITSSDGDFQNTTNTFAANNWTQVGTGGWYSGTGAGGASSSTKSAFIGTSTLSYGGYNPGSLVVKHFYRDIAIPAGPAIVSLNFFLRQTVIDNLGDYLYVYRTTTANTPVDGTTPGAGYTLLFSNTATQYNAFTAVSTIDLSALAGTTVRLVFTYKNDNDATLGNPAVDKISLTHLAVPSSPVFYSTGSTTQLTINNGYINDNTPQFRVSSTHGATITNYQVEINTTSAFSGTSYTQSFTGSYASGTPYDLDCNSLSPSLPATDGTTYYVRIRASADGSNFGSWTSGTYSFTYKSSAGTCDWMQTTTAQFQTNTLASCASVTNSITNITQGSITNKTISASTDDAYDSLVTGVQKNATLNTGKMKVGYDGSFNDFRNGYIFRSVSIPAGATITSASITLKAYAASTGTASNTIYGIAEDNAVTFDATTNKPSSKTKTTASINWSAGSWAANSSYASPDLTTIVQEIVNRGGWASNNGLGFVVTRNGGSSNNFNQVYCWDNSSLNSAKLSVTWYPKATVVSTAINFSSFYGATSWNQFSWTDDLTGGNIKYQLCTDAGGTTLIPDTDLPNNSTGLTSPVNLSNLNTTTYPTLYIKATLSYSTQSPIINDWKISVNNQSATSDIIRNTLFTEPQNIIYGNYQTASSLTTTNSVKIGSFTLRDGGSSGTDTDNKSTILTDLTFAIQNSSDLRTLALFDGTINLTEQSSVTSTTTFSGIAGLSALDNSTKSFDVYATFNTAVTDNHQIKLTISSATTDFTGSNFASADAGGAATSTSGANDNKITVTASKLYYSVSPPNEELINKNFSLTVCAYDALNNLDLDINTSVTLSENGSGTLSSISDPDLSSNLNNGSYTWSDLTYNVTSSAVVITATHSTLSAVNNSPGTNFSTIATVGTSGKYTTIQAAYNYIKGLSSLPEPYYIEMLSDYSPASESLPIIFDSNNASSTNTITLRPASSVASTITLSGSPAVAYDPIIYLNNCANVVIDGRAGGTGSTSLFTIRNTTNPSTASAGPAVEFANETNSFTLRYCKIESESETNGSLGSNGVIYLSACSTTCLDNITIEYNEIGDITSGGTAATPFSGIFLEGSTSINSDNIIISKNKLYDCMTDNQYTGYIVNLANTHNLAIKQNFIYRTSTFSYTQNPALYNNSALFYLAGNNTAPIIAGNFIGGNDNDSTDSDSFTISGSSNFFGIKLAGTLGGTAIINNNHLNGINLTNTGNARLLDLGINGTQQVRYNRFANITLDGNAGIYTSLIYAGNGTFTITNNILGSTSTNNITLQGNTEYTGILHNSTNTGTIQENTLQQFNASNTGTSNKLNCIKLINSGKGIVTSNTIQNITSATTCNGSLDDNQNELCGIWASNNSTQRSLISNNTIKNLSITYTGSTNYPSVAGIHLSSVSSPGAIAHIEKNLISGLTSACTYSSAAGQYNALAGIVIGPSAGYNQATAEDSVVYIDNNIVLLDNTAGTNTYGNFLYGIFTYLSGSDGDNDYLRIYHNTIKLSGTRNSGVDSKASACLYTNNGAGKYHLIKNNVLSNSRESSTTNHHAMWIADNTNIASDYNYFDTKKNSSREVAATVKIYECCWTNNNYDFDGWQARAGNPDANSKSYNDGNLTIDNSGYITSPTNWAGKDAGLNLLSQVPQDKTSSARDASPWMGALESDTPLPLTLLQFFGKPTSEGNWIIWKTTEEKQLEKYELMRSENGKQFDLIGTINPSNTFQTINQYKFLDITKSENRIYYRLYQTDIDGNREYLGEIRLTPQLQQKQTNLSFFPNPTIGKITCVVYQETHPNLELITLTGEPIVQLKLTESITEIELSEKIPNGIYLLKLGNEVQKLVLNR